MLLNERKNERMKERQKKLAVDFDVEFAGGSRRNSVIGDADVHGHVIPMDFRYVEHFPHHIAG